MYVHQLEYKNFKKSQILHSKWKQYWIPNCGTEHVI